MPEFRVIHESEAEAMFIELTEEQKKQANNASIVEILDRSGYEVRRIGSEYEGKGEAKIVSIIDNLWFDHYDQTGGNALGLVKKHFNMDYQDTMLFILGEAASQIQGRHPISYVGRLMKHEAQKLLQSEDLLDFRQKEGETLC